MRDLMDNLREQGIKLTPQRLAVAQFVLATNAHPTADQVWERVRVRMPTVSRATVYNTLNLLVQKGLLRIQILREGTVVFDPMVERHHHFIDDDTGKIYDIPADALRVTQKHALNDFDVREYEVIIRGRRKHGSKKR